MHRRIEFPMNKVILLENFGSLFDTSIVLEDELEDGHRTSLDKTDGYFYAAISIVLRDYSRSNIPFK
jgi:hypothetical protein